MKHIVRTVVLGACMGGLAVSSWAAPFAGEIRYMQPDGTEIVLFGEGDEFHADFETLEGYTVVFNHQTKAYEYAELSADGSELLPSGLVVGVDDFRRLGKAKHLRIRPEAKKEKIKERFLKWDEGMEVTSRWKQRKSEHRKSERRKAEKLKKQKQKKKATTAGDPLMAPADSTSGAEDEPVAVPPATGGAKVGLTLLIDFSDDPATIPQADIVDYCNGDNYTGYSNNGSVKEYFYDNSGGLLTYINVVTVYIRVPHPKSYYNDTSVEGNSGSRGRLLITDAIAAMKELPNYNSEILPTFSGLTVDGNNRVVALNVFFSGASSGVWSSGLWPHSWSLASSVDLGNGRKAYRYQITNIGTSPSLHTFCHENGHMLLGYPDLYDYDGDSKGGAGKFCLMGNSSYARNPSQICAYLKYASGWSTTIELDSSSSLLASVSSSGSSFNTFYRYRKPGVDTEYYLIENRQKSGRDYYLPAAGVAIWHIDELGDRDNQSIAYNTSHENYEVSLIQADNLYHFQNNVLSGNSTDLYYSGNTASAYNNTFSDFSAPSARWWDGTASGLHLSGFSASGSTMTFDVANSGLSIVEDVVVTNTPAGAGQASFDFGPATISAFLGEGETTPNAFINSGNLNWIGVNSSSLTSDSGINSINDADGVLGGADQERLRIELKPASALTELVWSWARANGPLATDGVSISGFSADPGAVFSGGISGTPTYSGGILRFQISTFNGTANRIAFTNSAASAGATLEITIADSNKSKPAFAIRSLSFTQPDVLFYSDFDDVTGAAVLAGGADNTTGSASASVSWVKQDAVESISGLAAISTGDSGTGSGFVELYGGTAPYANANNILIGRNHNLDTDRSTSKRGFSLDFTVDRAFSLGPLTVRSGHVTANGVDQVFASSLVCNLSGGTLAAPVSVSSVEDYSQDPVYHNVVFDLAGTVVGAGTYTLEVYQTQMTGGGAYAAFDGMVLKTVNVAPVPGIWNIGALEDQSRMLAVSDLLSAGRDLEDDPLSIPSVASASSEGGSLNLSAGTITYTPASGFVGADAFAYLLADAQGASATGTVSVNVVPEDAAYNRLSTAVPGNNALVLGYQGIPWEAYVFERSTNLTDPVGWIPVHTNTAGADGWLNITNSTIELQGYFRVRTVP